LGFDSFDPLWVWFGFLGHVTLHRQLTHSLLYTPKDIYMYSFGLNS